MKLFSYVVARDYGFAPNPFFGVCTLATCKPNIRAHASVEDWIIGTGSGQQNKTGFLVYAMRITETLTFNEYWQDERFSQKKPNLRGSKKQAFGDNIYFQDGEEQWQQQDSHHSWQDGSPNEHNIARDTKTNRVLISTDFAYWGGSGPEIPQEFRNYDGKYDICKKGQGHRCNFPNNLVRDFISWIRSLNANGFIGTPLDWPADWP